jgi:hypothetical protein
METNLLIIKNPLTRNRIKQELGFLKNREIFIEDEYYIKQYTNIGCNCYHCIDYVIEFKNSKDNKYYKFIISNYYPFKPPKLYINNKPFTYYYEIKNYQFNENLKKYIGIECFCCRSMLCMNNWGPQFTIISVLDEINICRDARNQILIRIMIDVIKRKYLLNDINIIEWLY